MKDDKSMQNLCLHTHNFYCDGKVTIEEMVESAINQGVTQLGISSHAPLKISNKWSMDINDLEKYAREIEKLKQKYRAQIDIFLSLEIDYIPEVSFPIDYFREKLNPDYCIGSIHLVKHPEQDELWFIDGDKDVCIENMNRIFNGDVQYAVQAFFRQTREMIRTQKPDIIGHLDKVIMNTGALFSASEQWYQDEVEETLELIKVQNAIVEVNTRGLYKGKWRDTFPSKQILNRCFEMDIPLVISSDAHHSSEIIGAYDRARKTLLELGFTHQWGRSAGGWKAFVL
jgi:histidinol-phosphatase (PHP family)